MPPFRAASAQEQILLWALTSRSTKSRRSSLGSMITSVIALLLDVLAGRTSFAELAKASPSSRPNPFGHPSLLERSMSSVEVARGGTGDEDDYVEFTFGSRSALNGPFLAQRPSKSD